MSEADMDHEALASAFKAYADQIELLDRMDAMTAFKVIDDSVSILMRETVKGGELGCTVARFDPRDGRDVSQYVSASDCELLSKAFSAIATSLRRRG